MEAKQLGVIDDFTTDATEAVKGADVIFLAVPLGAMQPILKSTIKDHISEHAIITDGGSAKDCVKKSSLRMFLDHCLTRFILGHPIAGREKSGVSAAIDDLYEQRKGDLNACRQYRCRRVICG